MRAVDTNIVVRLLVTDDARQASLARSVFRNEQVWISKTVLLETQWVLRHFYSYSEETVRNALTALIGLPNVEFEDQEAVVRALWLSERGLEFADALHLASCPAPASFLSFDRNLIRRANRLGIANASYPSVH